MNLLYPRIERRHLPLMLGISAVGALIAGGYGILHDQVSYTLSEEYFTKLKFAQFHYADFGGPRRVLVAEIGFMATWWVGFVAGWFLARLTVPHLERSIALRRCRLGFAVVFVFALIGGLVGAWLGWLRIHEPDFSAWAEYADINGVEQMDRFVWVAYIHNSGYAGGLAGLIAALIHARCRRRADMSAKTSAVPHLP